MMSLSLKRWRFSLALLCFALVSSLTPAQKPQLTPKQVPDTQTTSAPSYAPNEKHELTADDIGAFLDGLVNDELAREDIAGATVGIVKDGKVIFAKGYGFADVEKQVPVTAEGTLFRPGSISKLFTWTSVMQLVQEGKLDLDKDVNEYLDFKIPPRDGKPITLRNIMTHTPGFEETVKDLFVPSNKEMVDLDKYVKAHTPTRIYAPGTIPAYSNYATTVAGYIVQRVSGKPFYQYAQDNVIGPLGMKHTTFVQPLPADLAPMMSKGYQVASQPAKDFEFVQAYPAGSVSTTALDMCNFMMAHLNNGSYNGVEILKPETAQLMHARQWGYDDRLNHMALGFYEDSTNGHRIIAHGGDTQWFHSQLKLVLDQNLGFFISVNSAGKGGGSVDIFQKFMDRYYPYTWPAAEKIADPKADAFKVAGKYIASRRMETSFLSVLNAFGQLKVTPKEDGTILVDLLKDPNGEPKHYEEIAPLMYREVHGTTHVGFKQDANGSMVLTLDWPFFIFMRPPAFGNENFNKAVLIYSLGLFLLTLLLWPVAAMARKHYAHPLDLTPKQRRMRLFVRLICLYDLLFVCGWLLLLSQADAPGALNDNIDKWLILLMVMGVVAVLLSIVVILNAVRNWGQRQIWIWGRLHDVALAVACIAFSWFLWYWHFIGFNMKY
jgi:CubicO group peptidase (beta-lactamase class C family)